eukprot:COSAG02_NODE_3165_length_7245_cov_27.485586_7_plen_187_part_00
MYVGLRKASFSAVGSACSAEAGKNGYRFEFWSTTPIFAKNGHTAAQNGLRASLFNSAVGSPPGPEDSSVGHTRWPERPQCRDARGHDVATLSQALGPQLAQNLRAHLVPTHSLLCRLHSPSTLPPRAHHTRQRVLISRIWQPPTDQYTARARRKWTRLYAYNLGTYDLGTTNQIQCIRKCTHACPD